MTIDSTERNATSSDAASGTTAITMNMGVAVAKSAPAIQAQHGKLTGCSPNQAVLRSRPF